MTSKKISALRELEGKLEFFSIPKFYTFYKKDWDKNNQKILQEISVFFEEKDKLAIRSAAIDEDNSDSSCAGKYDSVLNVECNNKDQLIKAISSVINSYKVKNFDNDNNQIIIQLMVEDISMSGVAFTHEMTTGAPYYTINYDDISGSTDTVTSGLSEYANRTLYVFRGKFNLIRSERFKALIKAIKELEKKKENKHLDIEFAVTNSNQVVLLQVREMTKVIFWSEDMINNLGNLIENTTKFFIARNNKNKYIFGESTILGQMPDWNPAEMIGRTPKLLAYSLYEKLITKDAWRIARDQMGYFVPKGQPLMLSLGGQPYIDVRLSFNSFINKNINHKIAEKIVNAWIKRLSINPQLHDKVEFEVAIPNYIFDFSNRFGNVYPGLFSKEETKIIENSYLDHLNFLLDESSSGSIESAEDKINKLFEIQSKSKLLEKENLYTLIDDCINLGTIPFSILARHGFIANSLLQSLIRLEILDKSDIDSLYMNIKTIASDIVNDLNRVSNKEMPERDFFELYGHLRPGTYDITSKTYNELGSSLFSKKSKKNKKEISKKFQINKNKKIKIDKLLKSKNLYWKSSCEFFDYVKKAIKGREYGKYVFTRNVSKILEKISQFGKEYGLSRNDLSFIEIDDFLKISDKTYSISAEKFLKKSCNEGKDLYKITESIRLPQIIIDESSLSIVPFQVNLPNFIGSEKKVGKIIFLENDETLSLNNKIVLLENADPGFDWIFSQSIMGLVTKYGGSNSHMAIRCSEFNITAAIGCGEQIYHKLKKSSRIELDPRSKKIEAIY